MIIQHWIYSVLIHFSLAITRTLWIANKEIGLDPNKSVIKMLWLKFGYLKTKKRKHLKTKKRKHDFT